MINTNPPAPPASSGRAAYALHGAAHTHSEVKSHPAASGKTLMVASAAASSGAPLRPVAFSMTPTAWPDSVLDASTGSNSSTTVVKTAGPSYLPRVDVLENLRDNDLRVDLDALLPYGFTPAGFFRAGIFDLGGSNLANLEYGMMLDPVQGTAFRFGLYKSKLSIGADYGLSKQISLNADLYGLNGVNADIHGVYMLNSNFGIVAGVDNVLRNAGPVLGIEYRR
jgi:hypothetical protein